MLAKEARKKMRLSKQAFTNLLVTVDDIGSRPYRAIPCMWDTLHAILHIEPDY
jgi:hypothetical protein